ncbi:sugar phosphate nucleotidyltransferase [Paenibacillus lignilyticus]|uniref:Cupin domain-containing protein n=1 Tax=Paenibacillus lignilyticus TaxID=1172615 RepID=A0ABS5CCV6_9BACL|nr:sugar phosphate nucleotidyltransferase [Paenibacillus lignilyticus]MBP3961807.1 cupin domain-containing protein [Paenibacillus lignilyticus]MBP3963522.1 cupin domain-containing protein [Paenibacillus lignilyticus]
MKVVLLSGGSGKRLWPLSNDARSKQFLKILKKDDDRLESMIQRVWGQIGEADLQNHAYVTTSKPQVEMIQSQLGNEINLIVEPERRDTFPAIALAATYLYSVEGVSLDEAIVVMPVDPFVEIGFFEKLKELEQVLASSDADLALMGVKPTYPSEKYGYIIPKQSGDAAQTFMDVQSFREKPREEEAVEMIRQDALWNCGVFAFKLDLIINILIVNGLPIQYEEMLKQYSKLPKISFDYKVVEKANRIAAIQYDGSWKDLGTWNTLTEEIETSLIGKGIITADSINTHVINELEVPITLLGLSDVIVAASPDGILVADKASSPQIKDVMKHSEQRPMYEERRWGRYRVLDYVTYPDGREVLTKRIFISEGSNLSYQYHSLRDEVWTVVAGHGEMVLNGKRFSITTGDVLLIPKENRHSLRALADIEIIEIQTGSQLIEEDIVRLEHDWNEIMQLCTK